MRHVPALVLSLLLALPAAAQAQPADGAADRTIAEVRASAGFRAAVATLDREHDRIVEDIVTITEIPAPPFKEARRAEAYAQMFRAHGLSDVKIDAEGNVLGLRRGTGPAGGPVVVMSAHLDTVFPEGVDVTVRREGTKLHAPGVGDDSRALAVLLGYIRALDAGDVRTRRDILFVGTVGEEGQGDLRGVRHLFLKGEYKDRIAAFFSMDGANAARVTNGGVGSKRYRAVFTGPGGHSYGAFGIVNPLAALGDAVTRIYQIQVAEQPRTTYSASVIGGGTSVNSIPEEVFVEIDMRSESAEALATLERHVLEILQASVAAENAARDTRFGLVAVDPRPIGDRPAGGTPPDADIVRFTAAAARAEGYAPELGSSSTDSNIPMSLGVPAVTIGSGGTGGRAHAPDEWIDVAKPESLRGMTVGLAALIATAGLAR